MKSAPWPPFRFANGAVGSSGFDADERADEERVVVLLAEEEELGEVAVDREAVVAVAAEQRRRLADAVREVAARRQRRVEEVVRVEAVVGVRAVARRLEDLADLERVVALVAEDRRRREVVVHDERVVAVAAEDLDAAVDLAVVVDALGDARRRRADRATWNAATMPRRGWSTESVARKQEDVRGVGAEDAQLVDARVGSPLAAATGRRRPRSASAGRPGRRCPRARSRRGRCRPRRAASARPPVPFVLRRPAELVVVDADDVVAAAEEERRRAADRRRC